MLEVQRVILVGGGLGVINTSLIVVYWHLMSEKAKLTTASVALFTYKWVFIIVLVR